MRKMQERHEIQEEIPSEIVRYRMTLKELFDEYGIDCEINNDLFEALIDWKRTL